MRSTRLSTACVAVALGFALLAVPSARAQDSSDSSDGICDEHAADAADDPDCASPGGGRTCDWADECGTAESCESATTCDNAGHCDYADTCGDAETCVEAETCATADHATTCDSAATATECASADTADLALSVDECVSGVFSVGGEAVPDCGDLRYDGNVGIRTDPTATLDVAGTVALRGAPGGTGLQVAADGSVGIGTDAPTAALDVAGVVVADAFVTAPTEKTRALVPTLDCRLEDPYGYYYYGYLSEGIMEFDRLYCGASLPAGAVLTGLSCAGSGDVGITVTQRDGAMATAATWTGSGALTDGVEVDIDGSSAPAVEDGGTILIELEASAYWSELYGCQLRYEVTTWL